MICLLSFTEERMHRYDVCCATNLSIAKLAHGRTNVVASLFDAAKLFGFVGVGGLSILDA